MFVGRSEELKYLEKRYKNIQSEFIVLYGRRRIGKTELINQFVKDKSVIYYSANEVDDYEQLSRFSSVIGSFKNDASLRYNSWDDAFIAISNIDRDNKLVLVIDEFPYMVNGNKAIPSILQNIWDHNLVSKNIMIILSGSSISVMLDDILGANNPLYGRITGSYKLLELPFENIGDFFTNYTQNELVRAYSILGGVPQYLKAFNPNQSLEENIIENILSKGSRLYDEVNMLMRQELREPSIYFTLLEAIAMGNTKLNDIHLKTLIDKTKINAYLTKLIALDIIKREFPVTEKQKRKANVQSGLYKINTNFFVFYFRYVFPNTSMLELGAKEILYKTMIADNLSTHEALVYEDICRYHVTQLNISGQLFGFMKEIGRWWYKGDEIDIVGYNDTGQYIFGECKYRNELCTEKTYFDLINKSRNFFIFKEARYYLFSKSGFSERLLKIADRNPQLTLITL